jgi:hypothetical protein
VGGTLGGLAAALAALLLVRWRRRRWKRNRELPFYVDPVRIKRCVLVALVCC